MSKDKEINMIVIETVKLTDAARLLEIYRPYVEKTAISFEYKVPTLLEFEQRIKTTVAKYPYLVAKDGNQIVGYAYTSAFKQRAAYDWAVETSIYVDVNYCGQGIGSALYRELEKITKKQNIINMNACISSDNQDSISFHKKNGYRQVAYFSKCGYKFNKRHDMIWMEKFVGKHPDNPKPVISYCKLLETKD